MINFLSIFLPNWGDLLVTLRESIPRDLSIPKSAERWKRTQSQLTVSQHEHVMRRPVVAGNKQKRERKRGLTEKKPEDFKLYTAVMIRYQKKETTF